jgi:hypothetical protein
MLASMEARQLSPAIKTTKREQSELDLNVIDLSDLSSDEKS